MIIAFYEDYLRSTGHIFTTIEIVFCALFVYAPPFFVVGILIDALLRIRRSQASSFAISPNQMLIQLTSTIAFALSDLLTVLIQIDILIGYYCAILMIIINWVGFVILTVTLVNIADL